MCNVKIYLIACAIFAAPGQRLTAAVNTVVGGMSVARRYAAAAILPEGRVLVLGGGNDNTPSLASAEFFDPRSNRFTSAGNMITPRVYHTATALPDGRVLIVGGAMGGQGTEVSSAELFDPRDSSFRETYGPLTFKRQKHSATLMKDGRVLIACGNYWQTGGEHWVARAEIFDPASQTFAPTGELVQPQQTCASLLLDDGRVILVGDQLQIFDPSTNTFTLVASPYRLRSGIAPVRSPSGEIILAALSDDGRHVVAFNPNSAKFRDLSPLPFYLISYVPVVRWNGDITLVAGLSEGGASDAILTFSTGSETFVQASQTFLPRYAHTATVLHDGSVLITGGWDYARSNATWSSAEIYSASPPKRRAVKHP